MVTQEWIEKACSDLVPNEEWGARQGFLQGASLVKERYDNFMREGRLREVKLVEFIPKTEASTHSWWTCSGCKCMHTKKFSYCPSCGNPIKH